MSAKSDYKQKRSLARKQDFHAFNHALNHGLAVSVIWGNGMNFLHQIEKEEEKTLTAMRRADAYASAGAKSLLENSPELYHVKRGFSEIYRLHNSTGDCNPEMSETERSFVYCASRHESPDRPIS